MSYFNQESDRLRFRKLTEEDIPGWVEFFVGNDSLKFLGLDLQKSKEELADGWIRAQFSRYENHGLGHLAVELKSSGEFIGLGGILPRTLNGHDEFEIAYSLKPRYWGKGYATEVASTMKAYGFASVDSIRFISIIDIGNIASANVARKNGMKVLFTTEFLGMNVNVFGIMKQVDNKLVM